MLTESYSLIFDHVMNGLLPRLSKDLTYHSIHHTRDVVDQALRIAELQGIGDESELFLLKTAALYHDTGFLNTYRGHEEESCKLAENDLPAFGLTDLQIERIKGMIRATRLPQDPQNIMEEIICDADLDYLGRPDFFTIAQKLYLEMKAKGKVNTEKEWDQIQVGFLKSHKYFTSSSQQDREPLKSKHLQILEDRNHK